MEGHHQFHHMAPPYAMVAEQAHQMQPPHGMEQYHQVQHHPDQEQVDPQAHLQGQVNLAYDPAHGQGHHHEQHHEQQVQEMDTGNDEYQDGSLYSAVVEASMDKVHPLYVVVPTNSGCL
jgi:hypothetical protein